MRITRNTRGCGIKKSSAAVKIIGSDVPAILKIPIPPSITAIHP